MNLSIMARPTTGEARIHLIAAVALVAAFVLQTPLFAQGLQREEAIDAIVGSEVKTEEVKTEDLEHCNVDQYIPCEKKLNYTKSVHLIPGL